MEKLQLAPAARPARARSVAKPQVARSSINDDAIQWLRERVQAKPAAMRALDPGYGDIVAAAGVGHGKPRVAEEGAQPAERGNLRHAQRSRVPAASQPHCIDLIETSILVISMLCQGHLQPCPPSRRSRRKH
jgi:hypothetical protein